jgi:hypothetical protein
MCFSEGMSLGLAVATFAAGVVLHRRGTRLSVVQLFYVFGAMELLQFAQWRVAEGAGAGGSCESGWNRAFTVLAWLHVSLQPLSMNAYLFSGPGYYSTPAGCAKRQLVLRLCAASASLMLLRLPFPGNPLTWLGDRFGALVPELPMSKMAGTRCGVREAMCGPRLCTYKAGAGGSGHLGWELPLLPSSYFLPNASLHFFVFFLPNLFAARHLVDYLIFPTLMLTGPLVSMWLSATPASPGSGVAPSYAHEWPSVWCMLSVAQVALALVRESALSGGKSGKAARAAALAARAEAAAARAARTGAGKGAPALGAVAVGASSGAAAGNLRRRV